MKLNNETKVGLLAIIAIVVLILGFNFLRGSSVFSKAPVLYAEFPNIGGLQKSNPVRINGLDVGTVANLTPKDNEVNRIIAEIHLTREINIPQGSIAVINEPPLGTPYINIAKGPSKAYLQSGDTIRTSLSDNVLAELRQQITPTITRVNETLDSLKVTIGSVNDVFDPNTKNNMRQIINNLTLTSAALRDMMNAQNGVMAQSLGNINSVTGNLARNNDAITSTIRNVEVTTSNLANANIQGTVAALQSTIKELQNTIKGFNSSNGTLGLLMNDRQLYDKLDQMANRLNTTALSAEILLDDVRVHPKRYVNFSVFGGKNKGEPLTSPARKDTTAVKQ
jgi:phospholipid/cholesterol/gamma-HCH transport system substrate-binding protein